MAGFAKDVTTPVEIPSVPPVNLGVEAPPGQNAAALLSFGLNLQQKNRAIKAEEARQATLTKGLEIAKGLEDLQGQVSPEKFFVEAQKRVRSSGGSVMEQAQIGSIVAGQFGTATLSQGIMTESEKHGADLEQELRGLGEFGDIALIEKFPSSTSSELDNDSTELVIERARQLQADAIKSKTTKQRVEEGISRGNLNTIQDWFKADKEQFNALGGAMTSLYSQQLAIAADQGLELSAENLQSMKESTISVLESAKRNIQDKFSGDVLLQIPDMKERNSIKTLVDDRERFYSEQIEFVNSLEDDKFKNFFDTAALLKEKDELDLMRSSPEFLRIKNLMGTQAFGALISERLAKDPNFRNQLKAVQMKAFEGVGFDHNDQFAAGVSIMAGIGEGKTIQDYDSSDMAQASNVYWSTVKGFMNTPEAIDNSTSEGISSMAIASVQVLEFAEERGTIEDKQRAIQTINSPQFKKLYDKAPAEIREAMGRKVIQYNRDTLEDNVSRIMKESAGAGIGSTVTYDTTSGQFQVEFEHVSKNFSGDPTLSFQQKQQKKKVDALNKQLDVAKIYGKDDPFISSLNEREARDFFVRSTNMSPELIKGKLTEFTPEHEEASRKGVTLEELRARTDATETTSQSAGIFSDIERQVQQANLDPNTVQQALGKVQSFLDGTDKEKEDLTQALQDAETDEEALEILKQLRKLNGK